MRSRRVKMRSSRIVDEISPSENKIYLRRGWDFAEGRWDLAELWMRSSRVFEVSDFQWKNCKSPADEVRSVQKSNFKKSEKFLSRVSVQCLKTQDILKSEQKRVDLEPIQKIRLFTHFVKWSTSCQHGWDTILNSSLNSIVSDDIPKIMIINYLIERADEIV